MLITWREITARPTIDESSMFMVNSRKSICSESFCDTMKRSVRSRGLSAWPSTMYTEPASAPVT